PIFWPARFVVRRSKPHFEDSPSSRLASGQNLWPRHLRSFMRWLLGSRDFRTFFRRGRTSRATANLVDRAHQFGGKTESRKESREKSLFGFPGQNNWSQCRDHAPNTAKGPE